MVSVHPVKRVVSAVLVLAILLSMFLGAGSLFTAKVQAATGRQMEALGRGLVAVKTGDGVFLSWRLLGTESYDTSFNVYRNGSLIASNISGSTNYLDTAGSSAASYYVRSVVSGSEVTQSDAVTPWAQNYMDVPLQKPANTTLNGATVTYAANDATVADVDGDGAYEIILKWDPSNSQDNSKSGYTSNVYVDCYEMNGTLRWRIDLGRNIRAGAHYTQIIAYDLNGDGKAEVAMKTADGTVDGQGNVIGDKDADYRNSSGYILSGPEYLTLFEGKTGKELVTIDYNPPRGTVSSWGDSYGNRVDRFLAGVAYFDGKTPSLVVCRGYYTRCVIVSYEYKGGTLNQEWVFDSNASSNSAYAGEGNHNLSIADVDGDGYDEIVYGSAVIDHNGKGLYATGNGHGDALHVGDFDPDRAGLEVYQVHEETGSSIESIQFRDAATGKTIWSKKLSKDTGRGLILNIDPEFYPYVTLASGSNYHTAGGSSVTSSISGLGINFASYWDGDLYREGLDGTTVRKWDYNNNKVVTALSGSNVHSCNSTKSTPSLSGDILGDWREEVIWPTSDDTALRIYTTTDVTDAKLYTLMHDSQYRCAIAWQNVAYNQPPHTSYFIGPTMAKPTQPSIYTVGNYTLAAPDSGSGETHTHSYTPSVSLAATCESEGVRSYICACGASYSEAIPALGHSYQNDICANCGQLDPNSETAQASGYIHNFTSDQLVSSFYTISGNLSAKGTVSYGGMSLTRCLKMESATSVTFSPTRSGKLMLVFHKTGYNVDAVGQTVMLDGTAYTVLDGGDYAYVELPISAGAHELKRGSGQIFLYYMAFTPDASGESHIHSYTGNVTTAATCVNAGVKTYSCSCGSSYTEAIAALGHSYSGGSCTRCGAADPNSGSQDTGTYDRVTVHDPSIVEANGMYYIFGSHMAWAKSKDLRSWTTFTTNVNTNYANIFATNAAWAANGGAQGNSAYDVSGNLWAPDVIYNEKLGKWCMYMSVNGDGYYSSIAMATASNIEGPYTYAGTVVYSGFANSTQAAQTDFKQVTGTNTVPSRYLTNGAWNPQYGTNAIDPCVFYDKDGNLWMVYGSWFGGLFLLRLDESTGLRDYSYTYSTTTDVSDQYLGIRLSGGYGCTGEGPYIVYDDATGYYYLYVTYGGLNATDSFGNYNMRLFRSKSVTGPYTDAAGNSAICTSANADQTVKGIKLMGNYFFSSLANAPSGEGSTAGYKSPGHNSAFIDDSGNRFLIYHTRFNLGSEWHQVRVHQQFLNADGWPVTAVYEYRGDSISTGYTDAEIVGRYEFVNHGSTAGATNAGMLTTQNIVLNSNGTITGDVTGTWSRTSGSYYCTMVIDGVTYKGVFFKQSDESAAHSKVMTFSAIGSNNQSIWGSQTKAEASGWIIDSPTWWGNHSAAVQVTENIQSWTFTNTTYADAADNWDTASVVVFRSSNGTVSGSNYIEELLIRSDSYAVSEEYGWDTTGQATFSGTTSYPSDWATWLAANKSGASCTVTAQLVGDRIIVGFRNNGVVNVYSVPKNTSSASPVYLNLTGEETTMTAWKATSNHIDISDAVAAADPNSGAEEYLARDAFFSMEDSSINRMSSEHFQIIWGNADESGQVNEEFVRGNLTNLENIWDFYVNVLGMKEPNTSMTSGSSQKYKTNFYISNTGLGNVVMDDWAYMSVDAEGFAYMCLMPGAMRVDEPSWVLPHELAHVFTYHQGGNEPYGYYEAIANWFRDQYLGSTYYAYGGNVYGPTSDFFKPYLVNHDYYFPHIYNWYDAWPILLYISENPDNINGLGMDLIHDILENKADGSTIFAIIDQLSDVSVKDILGYMTRRMVTLDFSRQEYYQLRRSEQMTAAEIAGMYTTLESKSDGYLHSPASEAPMQGGFNIIALDADLSKGSLNVEFAGTSTASGADYRASIVTVTASGDTRYSSLFSSGIGSIALQGDEIAAYVVVCATPDTMEALTTYEETAVGTRYTYKLRVVEDAAHTHSYTSSVTTAASCTTAGVRTYQCACGNSYTETIAALGHNYVNGTCTRCGAADPSYNPGGDVVVPANSQIHNFTDDGFSSTFYTFAGDQVTNGKHGTYTYDFGSGTETLNYALKFDSKGSVTFTATADGTLTIAAASSSAGRTIVINNGSADIGTMTIDTASKLFVLTVDVSANTTYTVARDSGESGLYYIAYIPASSGGDVHTHSYTASVTTNPTCTAAGVKTYSCSCGASYTEVIPATGHSYTSQEFYPNCTNDGYILYTCSCGATYTETGIASQGHFYENGACTYCGAADPDYVPPHTHSYSSKVTAPTCTAQGYTTYTCATCGDSYTGNQTAAKGHSYSSSVTKVPDCTNTGVRTYTCSACSDSYTEAIAALGHTNAAAVKENEKAASCGADGSYDSVVYCSSCGVEISRNTITVPATGEHVYATETKRVEATCTADGYVVMACGCGATQQSTLKATGHTLVTDAAVAPTCTATGKTEGQHCSVCGEVTIAQQTVAAKGHSFANGVCTVCGAADPEYVAGVTVSGQFVSSGEVSEPVTIQLILEGQTEAAYSFVSDGTAKSGAWSIDGVAAGNYTVKVMKADHVTREYALTVGNTAVTQNVKICLLGDVNNDGNVNISDYVSILTQVKNPGEPVLVDYYRQCADTDSNGAINFMDYLALLSHVKNVNRLW